MFSKEQTEQYIKDMKARHPVQQTLGYPSVVRTVFASGPVWMALYMRDGIPQHCLCSSEAQAWHYIDYYSSDKQEGKNENIASYE